jgi:MFS family permease
MLLSQRLKMLPRKRAAVLVCALAMAAIFLGLASMFWLTDGTSHWWMPIVFLVGYTLFFAATGINNISLGTLQGKLVHATRRGRLLLTANVVGAITAIAAVALLMPYWLHGDVRRFDMIFGFTAICFAISALSMLLVAEPPDEHRQTGKGAQRLLSAAWQTVRTDHNFRQLALVAMAFGASLALFPHYQALGRSPRLGLPLDNLMLWVIVQNVGTALFSLLLGPVADRFGNRLVLRIVLLAIASMPPTAIALSYSGVWGRLLFPGVFVFIGMTPVGFKTITNYTLEISQHEDHPKYLSTLGLCFAVPLLASPLLGWIVAATGFEVVFFGVSAVILAGWLLTFRLSEPRHGYTDEIVGGLPEGN